MKNTTFYEDSKRRVFKLALSLLLIAPGLAGCSTSDEKTEELNGSIYIVEESKKTPLQLKMDTYQDYQEIDPNEEVDHKYLEQMKNQMVVHQFHEYTQFDDFGYYNFPDSIEEIQNRYADSYKIVEYVKTLIVPTYFICFAGLKDWGKMYDTGQVINGEKIFSVSTRKFMYSTNDELNKIFENVTKEEEKKYRLTQDQKVQTIQ